MPSSRRDPFPFEAVRDLLGILRAMYAATPTGRTMHRQRIAHVAGQLRLALDLALETEPGTLGHQAAWLRAESAVVELGDLADVTTPIAPVLEAAGRRVNAMAPRGKPKPPRR